MSLQEEEEQDEQRQDQPYSKVGDAAAHAQSTGEDHCAVVLESSQCLIEILSHLIAAEPKRAVTDPFLDLDQAGNSLLAEISETGHHLLAHQEQGTQNTADQTQLGNGHAETLRDADLFQQLNQRAQQRSQNNGQHEGNNQDGDLAQ